MPRDRHPISSLALIVLGILIGSGAMGATGSMLPWHPRDSFDPSPDDAVAKVAVLIPSVLMILGGLATATGRRAGGLLGQIGAGAVIAAGAYSVYYLLALDQSAWHGFVVALGMPFAIGLLLIGVAILRQLRRRAPGGVAPPL